MHPTTLPDSGNTHDLYDIGFFTNQFILKTIRNTLYATLIFMTTLRFFLF